MDEKLLTISIAAYNVSDYLKETIESLLLEEALFGLLDIIIVNDGSKDDTLSIAEDFANKYPKSIRVINKENGGYGSTINASLPEAKGKYYKLLDGDDWFDKDGLKGLLSYLANTESDIVVTPFYRVKKQRYYVDHHGEIPTQETPMRTLKLGEDKLFYMHGIAVKTQKIQSYGKKIAEHCFYTDIEFLFYSFAASETISRYNQPVYCYRLDVDGQSASLKGLRKHYKDGARVAKRISYCYRKTRNSFYGTKQDIMQAAVTFSIYGMYNGYMLAGRHTRRALIKKDKEIQKICSKAFALGNQSKVVKWARRLSYHPYFIFRQYMFLKYKKTYERNEQ